MTDKIFNLLLITGAVHGILFNCITLTYRRQKKISKAILFLNLVVLSISLNNLQAWLIAKGYSSSWYFIKYLEVPWYVFIVPTFYSFLIHFLLIEKKYKNYIKSVCYLFLVEIIIRLTLITFCYLNETNANIINSYTRFEEITNALVAFYIFYKSYNIIYKERYNYKYALSFDDTKWLQQFMVLGSLVLIFWLIAIFSNFYLEIPQKNFYYPLRVGSSLLLYWIGYQGFLRYNIMTDRIQLRKEILVNKTNINTDKTSDTTTHKTDSQSKLFDDICLHIEANKLYLNENLSLDEVSKTMNISTSHLSKVINTHENINFTNLINEYRVNYAKAVLTDAQFAHYTIIAIGLESGFKSKSSFYSAFKKFTNQTPSEYRAEHSTS
ncbi:AraC family transcriptional regulator [Lacinutrix sp. Hel_I_90]|uniref:helix-turn-helix domain-containing protein n=1 Tax=Lacinutrix sp. Hel_I_90 TaxID=1249999 RepID=UPI0005C85742|nr:AraC family transcriptional regulator [Lacinutrix sp. Hel_I_90]